MGLLAMVLQDLPLAQDIEQHRERCHAHYDKILRFMSMFKPVFLHFFASFPSGHHLLERMAFHRSHATVMLIVSSTVAVRKTTFSIHALSDTMGGTGCW
jgi:hypothetical protein